MGIIIHAKIKGEIRTLIPKLAGNRLDCLEASEKKSSMSFKSNKRTSPPKKKPDKTERNRVNIKQI